jgi:PAS domain S-box-containing protein
MFGVSKGASMASPIRLRRYVWILAALGTVAIAVVLTWELLDEQNQAFDVARSEALGIWKKEDAIYRWAATQSAIYVPTADETQPDTNLASSAERDIATPSGRALTLISPPTIMRQIFALTDQQSAVRGHITSLRPIRPQNAADPWEKHALEAFASGQTEACSEETIDGNRYLRFMRPLVTEESCLGCHFEQGHKVGDIRGGLSVSLPMASVWVTQREGILHRLAGYGGMWIFGLCGIGWMSHHLQQQMSHRYEAERRLQEAHNLLEQRVAERTAELAEANSALEGEIVERKQAEQWLLESEQRFRGYFEQGLVGMAILTAERHWVEVNGRLCKMLGYSEEELLLKTWQDLTRPEDRPAADAQFQRLRDGIARGFVVDTRLVRKDGRDVHAGLSAQCLQRPDGTVDCLLILVQDMTHRQPA